jgi:hypothetical protein
MSARYSKKGGQHKSGDVSLTQNHIASSVRYIDGAYRAVVEINGQSFYISDLWYSTNMHRGTVTLHNLETGQEARLSCERNEYRKFKHLMLIASTTEIAWQKYVAEHD